MIQWVLDAVVAQSMDNVILVGFLQNNLTCSQTSALSFDQGRSFPISLGVNKY
jgi:hypothetical protein